MGIKQRLERLRKSMPAISEDERKEYEEVREKALFLELQLCARSLELGVELYCPSWIPKLQETGDELVNEIIIAIKEHKEHKEQTRNLRMPYPPMKKQPPEVDWDKRREKMISILNEIRDEAM